ADRARVDSLPVGGVPAATAVGRHDDGPSAWPVLSFTAAADDSPPVVGVNEVKPGDRIGAIGVRRLVAHRPGSPGIAGGEPAAPPSLSRWAARFATSDRRRRPSGA